jgi:hypothetical protein
MNNVVHLHDDNDKRVAKRSYTAKPQVPNFQTLLRFQDHSQIDFSARRGNFFYFILLLLLFVYYVILLLSLKYDILFWISSKDLGRWLGYNPFVQLWHNPLTMRWGPYMWTPPHCEWGLYQSCDGVVYLSFPKDLRPSLQ